MYKVIKSKDRPNHNVCVFRLTYIDLDLINRMQVFVMRAHLHIAPDSITMRRHALYGILDDVNVMDKMEYSMVFDDTIWSPAMAHPDNKGNLLRLIIKPTETADLYGFEVHLGREIYDCVRLVNGISRSAWFDIFSTVFRRVGEYTNQPEIRPRFEELVIEDIAGRKLDL